MKRKLLIFAFVLSLISCDNVVYAVERRTGVSEYYMEDNNSNINENDSSAEVGRTRGTENSDEDTESEETTGAYGNGNVNGNVNSTGRGYGRADSYDSTDESEDESELGSEESESEEAEETIKYDKSIAFDAVGGKTYRYEVFFDRSFPTIYFCIQDGSGGKFEVDDIEKEDGTTIEVRPVETISGQNFSVVYFTCGVTGTYTIEYSTSDCSTFILAETDVRRDFKTNKHEKRMDVKRIFYDIVGPYTEGTVESLLDTEYDPYASDAEEQINDKKTKRTIYIPINAFTVGLVVLLIGTIIFFIVKKKIKERNEREEAIRHKELLDRISSTKIADDEQNNELKEYWNIIKNDYYDDIT